MYGRYKFSKTEWNRLTRERTKFQEKLPRASSEKSSPLSSVGNVVKEEVEIIVYKFSMMKKNLQPTSFWEIQGGGRFNRPAPPSSRFYK